MKEEKSTREANVTLSKREFLNGSTSRTKLVAYSSSTLKIWNTKKVEKVIPLILLLLQRARRPRWCMVFANIATKKSIEKGIALNTWLRRRKRKKVNLIYLFLKPV